MFPRLLLVLFAAVSEVIPVRTQAEFDAFPETLANALVEADSVQVEFGPGTFFFREGHLELRGLDGTGKAVILSGNDTRLVAADRDGNAAFSPDDGWVDLEKDTDVSRMGPVHTARFYPIPSLLHRGRFRLRSCFLLFAYSGRSSYSQSIQPWSSSAGKLCSCSYVACSVGQVCVIPAFPSAVLAVTVSIAVTIP